jgi:hypothetical protein
MELKKKFNDERARLHGVKKELYALDLTLRQLQVLQDRAQVVPTGEIRVSREELDVLCGAASVALKNIHAHVTV